MGVMIGSIHKDENGNKATGNLGDQTGKEITTEPWFLPEGEWRVFRAKSLDARDKLGHAMLMASANNHIGYDENERNTLYELAKEVGFDISKVNVGAETDDTALVRVCCAYAGIELPDFQIEEEASLLLQTNAFTELADRKYTTQSQFLLSGDILVSVAEDYTTIVVNSGILASTDSNNPQPEPPLGYRIVKKGMKGADVKEMQELLIACGYSVGSDGADGDFGSSTERALKKFQREHKLNADGECGPKTCDALWAAQPTKKPDVPQSSEPIKQVQIFGGQCYVREQPNISGKILGVAANGQMLEYAGSTSSEGWNQVKYQNKIGWVSGRYSRIV